MLPLFRIPLLIAFFFSSNICHSLAATNSPDDSNHRILLEISQSSYWHKLIHYKSNLLFPGYRSDITDPAFFLAQQGRNNPYQELVASVNEFRSNPASVCQFPARYHWLSRKYGAALELESGKLDSCEELEQWRKKINPGSATLIFPAAYLNGPSSMFGHTLLRIEPADERANLPLITYAINYAANVTQQDNNVLFAFKGIFGGYPGVMSIVPYHEKIKEYGEIENRDIWEYRLNLDNAEISQMMRHAWELRHLRSDYFFFDINCSYLILNLLEVGREGVDLTGLFRFKVIPVDTVRVVTEANLVDHVNYRAAAATQLEQRYSYLTPAQQSTVQDILRTKPELKTIKLMYPDERDYARILEVVFDSFRYQAFQTPGDRDKNAAYNLQLLQSRSQIREKSIWPDIKVPDHRPDQGHKSARVALGYQRTSISDNAKNNMLLKLRPAYHDLLDPEKGYPFGAQINFFDFEISYDRDSHDANLDLLTIIDILSLTPVHDLFDPVSWRVELSYENRRIVNESIEVIQVTPGFGKSLYLFDRVLGYAMATSSLEYSSDFDKSYALGLGAQSGILFSNGQSGFLLGLEGSRFFSGQKETRYKVDAGIARHLTTDFSIRLNMSRMKLFDYYVNQHQVTLNWYF